MMVEIFIESAEVEEEALLEQIYEDVLREIIKECLSEVSKNEQSNNLPASIY